MKTAESNNHTSLIGRAFPGLIHWSLLPGMVFFAAMAIGIALAFQIPFSWIQSHLPNSGMSFWLTMCSSAATGITGVLIRSRLIRFATLLIFSFLLTIMHRNEQIETFASMQQIVEQNSVLAIHGKVIAPPAFFYENFVFLLKIDSIAGDHSRKWRGKTIKCIAPDEPPTYGQIKLRGTYSPPKFRQNPYAYDEYSAMMAAGLWGTITAKNCSIMGINPTHLERLSAGFRKVTLDALGKIRDYDNRALLLAAFFGDTNYLSPYIKDLFRRAGTYHLIAVSGLNTAMLTIALYFLLKLLRVRPTPTHCICLAALWMYQLYVGMIPSLFRATIMASFIIISLLFEKKNYPFHTIGLAGAIWLFLSPESLFLPGFQLSYVATAGLIGLVPLFSRYVPPLQSKIAKAGVSMVLSSLYISFVSFAVTAPILLYHFGTISYFGLFANLVAVVIMTFSMWAFFAGLLFQMTVPVISAVPLWISERFMDIVVATGKAATFAPWSQASYAAPHPETIIAIAIFFIGLATINRVYLGRFVIISCIAICCTMPLHHIRSRSAHYVEVVKFSDGKNSIAGVKWPDRKVWLIFPEGKSAIDRLVNFNVTPWLRRHSNERIDLIAAPFSRAMNIDSALSGLKLKTTPQIILYDAKPASDSVTNLLFKTPAENCTVSLAADTVQSTINVTIGYYDSSTTLTLPNNRRSLTKKRTFDRHLQFPGTDRMRICMYRNRVRTIRYSPSDHPLLHWE